MEYVVSILIVSLCLYLIIRPFFQKETRWQTEDLKDDLDNLNLEQIYATINELEMEYNMGKIPQEDYHRSKEQYERTAAQKLKEEADIEGETDRGEETAETNSDQGEAEMEDEMEQELEELRKHRRGKQ